MLYITASPLFLYWFSFSTEKNGIKLVIVVNTLLGILLTCEKQKENLYILIFTYCFYTLLQ